MSDLQSAEAELELLLQVADEAAATALAFFRNNAKVWTKTGNSPVSEADIAVDRLLRRELLSARPGYGYLSEETVDDKSRLSAPRSYVIDPIDGTRAFIAGTNDWTISLALVESGRPIVAVLAAPAMEERFTAIVGGGAFRDGDRIAVSDRPSLDGATLAISKQMLRQASGSAPIEARTVLHASLAYRLARVADGRIDATAIRPGACDWDVAAADLLVQEAGGALTNLDGSSLRYDRGPIEHRALVSGPPHLCRALAEKVASVFEPRA